MESRLVVVFVCAVCHLAGAQLFPVTALNTNITNTTCGISKLCVSSVAGCNPAGNSSCYFSSTQVSNGILTVEISGTTSGYVALGLTPTNNQTQILTQGTPVALVCGNYNNNAFFEIATQNGSVLNPVSLSPINATIQGSVSANQNLTQCTGNINLTSLFLTSALSKFNFSTLLNSTFLNATILNFSLLTLFNSTLLNSTLLNSTLIPFLNSTLVNSTLVNSTLLALVDSSVFNYSYFNSTFLSTVSQSPVSSDFLNVTLLTLFNSDSLLNYINSTFLNSTLLSSTITQSNFPTLGSITQNYPLSNSTIYSFLNSTILNPILLSFPAQLPFNITILNGTTNGTQLGNASAVFNSSGPLDLANPRSNVPAPVPLNITSNGCNSTKLCLSSPSNCDPAGNTSCFFNSVRLTNQTFFFELSGTTSGYVALGLTKNGNTTVFVCGNNSNTFFFQTYTQNGTTLTPVSVNTVYNVVGVVSQNQTLIQCVFNTSSSFNTSTKSTDTSYQVTILNGTTNGTQLGNASAVFNSSGPLDLANPRSNVPAPVSLNITSNGCNSTKLCLSSPSNCDPAGNTSCFFNSVRLTNQTFFFELSGTTSGYIALGLTKNGNTTVFVCGNNSNTFFFQTDTQNGTTLTPVSVNTVYNFVGVISQNQTLIQCVFNTSSSFNTSTKSTDTSYQVTILNGTTNGTLLGSATTLYDTGTALDLSNTNALTAVTTTAPNKSISSFCANVLAVLLSALILHFI